MNRETLKIVQKLDRESLEVQLLLQCAPMIAGLKASNLLIIASENEEDARKILNGTRISWRVWIKKQPCSFIMRGG